MGVGDLWQLGQFVPPAILFNVALCYTPSGFLGLLVCWKTGIRWLAIGLKP